MKYFFVFFLLWSSTIFADGSCPNNQGDVYNPIDYPYAAYGNSGDILYGRSRDDMCHVLQVDAGAVSYYLDFADFCRVTFADGGTTHLDYGGNNGGGDCGCAAGETEWPNADGSFSCATDVSQPPPPAPSCTEDTLYTGGCESQKSACDASGGTFGFVGSGDQMNVTCLPSDYMGADGLPPCSDGLYPINVDGGDVTCSAMPSPAPDGSQDTTGDGNTDGNAGNTDPGTGGGGTAGTGSTYGNGAAADTDGDGTSDGASVACDPATDASCIAGADTNGDGSPDSSAAPSDGCDAPPSCEGDAIQCAILFQSYENACTSRNFDAAKVEAATSLQARGRAAHDAVIGPRTDAAGVLAPLTSITGASGSCPAPYTIVLGALGSVVLSYDSFCSLAGHMRPFVLALFWFLSGRIVLSALLGKGN